MTAREFVLVHGACHGAWCWEEMARRLRAHGHRVVTLDLPGHGRRVAQHAAASVAAYARAVVDAMALEGVSRGILVGHSMSGLVIPKVVELAPERVAQLVFLAAVVLPDGGSLWDVHLLPGQRAMIRGLAEAAGNGTFRYPAWYAWSRWMNDLPRGHPAVVEALVRLTPQPLRPFVETVDLRRFYAMDVPRIYVRCLGDAAVQPPRAMEYARRLGVKPVDLDAAHDAMLSAPDRLVRILESLSPRGRG